VPNLGKSAGAKFTETRVTGYSAPEFFMAFFTLSLLSCTAVSGKPTIMVLVKPLLTPASTSIISASNPTMVADKIFAITILIDKNNKII
jgi:hypothetical protein